MTMMLGTVSPPPLSQFSSSSSRLYSSLPPRPSPPLPKVFSSSSSCAPSTSVCRTRSSPSFKHLASKPRRGSHICRAAEYKFPDPIPEFADAETEKFRSHLLTKLPKKKDLFGDSIDDVVGICTETFQLDIDTGQDCPAVLCTFFIVVALPIIFADSEEEERFLLVWVS
ncbi:hypothetical protein BT93_B2241 [Corymbia citriodora subsp. variegata]|nr:hypothetical protein BT93_B2241 [Corymbia citriodora subsp. variegata]